MVLWLLLLYHGGASILILTNQKNGFLTVIVETRFFYFRGVFAQPHHPKSNLKRPPAPSNTRRMLRNRLKLPKSATLPNLHPAQAAVRRVSHDIIKAQRKMMRWAIIIKPT